MAGSKAIISGEIAQNKKLRGKAMADALARQLQNSQNTGANGSKSYAKPRKK
jgi:uncharacterized protein YbjQ (UPF0145 family)